MTADPAVAGRRGRMRTTHQLKVGEDAPDFTLKDEKKNDVTLSSYKGKQNVLLAFFVMAFTPV